MAWNEKDDEQLKKLWASGLTGGKIATAIGRSRGSVLGRLWRLGLMGTRSRQQKRKGPPPGAFGLHNGKKPKPRAEGVPKSPKLATEPLPAEDASETPTKTIAELEPHHCRHRIDKPLRGDKWGFCGAETLPYLPVCETHAKRWYANWVEIKHRYVKQEKAKEAEPA